MVDGREIAARPSPAPAKRDLARWIAWSATAAVGVTLAIAGVVYKPGADLPTLCGSAAFALQLGAVDYAREQVGIAAKKDADDPWVNLLEARLAFLDKDSAAAERHLDKVLARDPENGEAHLYYGFVTFERNDWAAALDHYEKGAATLEKSPRKDVIAELHLRLAQLYLSAGRYQDALALGRRLTSEDSRPAAGQVISAFSRLGLGDDTEFGQELARAYSSDPFEPLFRQSPGPLAKAFPWLPAR